MPLSTGTSKEAREQNIKTEIAAGKDPKQAVAIGYAKQRENKRGMDRATAQAALDCIKGLMDVCDAIRHDPSSGRFVASGGSSKAAANRANAAASAKPSSRPVGAGQRLSAKLSSNAASNANKSAVSNTKATPAAPGNNAASTPAKKPSTQPDWKVRQKERLAKRKAAQETK